MTREADVRFLGIGSAHIFNNNRENIQATSTVSQLHEKYAKLIRCLECCNELLPDSGRHFAGKLETLDPREFKTFAYEGKGEW